MMRKANTPEQSPPQPAQYEQQPFVESKEGYDQETGEVDEGFDNDAPPVQ